MSSDSTSPEVGIVSPESLDISRRDKGFIITEIPNTRREFDRVYVGRVGQGEFKDNHEFVLNDLGITVSVDQASYGFTGVSAGALDGFEVEALGINPNTGSSEWKKPFKPSDKVTISGNWGNLQTMPLNSNWSKEDVGNQGVRAGVIKVTDTTKGEVKYYVAAAQFKGSTDNWNVRSGLYQADFSEKR